ncbi:MAG: dihydrodipicolinate synthase family protein, partial [Acidisphaera sp.]|nr:dihydrodipicolinate synthase family protein [Acidisphaera sp.]
ASIKTLVARRTGHADWNNVRPPLLPLTATEASAL